MARTKAITNKGDRFLPKGRDSPFGKYMIDDERPSTATAGLSASRRIFLYEGSGNARP